MSYLDVKVYSTYMITGENPKDIESFLKRVINSLKKGISLFQFRAHQLSEAEYIYLAKKILCISKKYNAKLILNCSVDVFNEIDADGLQLNSKRLHQFSSRPLNYKKLLSASCHNKEDLMQSEKIEANFVTLSPVLPTTSHQGEKHLGWSTFSELASCSNVPIFALGGLNLNHIQIAKKHGAIGIAAISALWNDIS